MSRPSEEQLKQAAHALGEAAALSSPEEKERIRALYARVQSFAEEQKGRGVTIDRSAFFAAGLVLHSELDNEAVTRAATQYLDLDRLFVIEASQA